MNILKAILNMLVRSDLVSQAQMTQTRDLSNFILDQAREACDDYTQFRFETFCSRWRESFSHTFSF